jgi:hypothetical protein
MKAALMQGPVVVGFIVYSDFDAYSSGVYEHVWGEQEGSHAVMVVGWDDSLSCWICKNSWGPSWGEQGYFRIRWGQCNLEPWSFWLTPASQPYPRLALSGYNISSDEGDGDLVANPGEEVAFAATLRNLPLWHDATDVSAQLVSRSSGVEVIRADGLFGEIASGAETANAASPFSVRIDDGESLGDVALELQCSSAEGGEELYHVVVPLDFRISLDQRGWPLGLGCAVTSSPLIATLEHERGPVVAFGDEAGLLHVVAPEGDELPGFPLDVGDQVKGAIAAGDVDGDGRLELILGTRSSEVWAVNPDGTVLFTLQAPGRVYATPALGDIDRDGLPDAVVGTINGSLLAVRWDGAPAPGFPVDLGEQVAAGAALADLDGDRSLEIVVGTLSSQVHILGSDGTEWPGWPRGVSGKIWAGPTVADLDGDGRWELLVGTQAGLLHALGATGERWVTDVGSWIRTSPGVADLDGDGRLEVLVGCDGGYVYAVDAEGGTAPGAWPAALGARVETSPVVADLDGDGAPEVVSGTTGDELWVLDAAGQVVAPFPAPAGSAVRSSPCVGDIDTDGDLEIAVGTATDAWVVDFKATGGTTDGYWSVFRGGAARAGVWGGGFITSASDIATGGIPSSYRLLPPAPNPCRGEIALSFEMPRPAWVSVAVFNPAGQAVSALHEGFLPAGRHRLVWATGTVAPGRYVYRLQSPDYVGTGAVVIAR